MLCCAVLFCAVDLVITRGERTGHIRGLLYLHARAGRAVLILGAVGEGSSSVLLGPAFCFSPAILHFFSRFRLRLAVEGKPEAFLWTSGVKVWCFPL